MWSDQCLAVDRCSSVDILEDQNHRLESNAGCNRKPVEVIEEGDDQCLDQELHCVFCQERLDPADVVDGKSARSGHSSDVVVLRLLIVDEGHTVTSSTVTDRSMRRQSFPRKTSSSVFIRLSLR